MKHVEYGFAQYEKACHELQCILVSKMTGYCWVTVG